MTFAFSTNEARKRRATSGPRRMLRVVGRRSGCFSIVFVRMPLFHELNPLTDMLLRRLVGPFRELAERAAQRVWRRRIAPDKRSGDTSQPVVVRSPMWGECAKSKQIVGEALAIDHSVHHVHQVNLVCCTTEFCRESEPGHHLGFGEPRPR